MSQYDITIDEHAANTSHVQILELVGFNKRVLDVGCATGYLAELLQRRGCEVAGVEVDPAAAEAARKHIEQVVVGDLEFLDLADAFGTASFDVVVFGDVLEHLRDPVKVLRGALPLLRPGGSVVISIPHVGHGDVRLALLQGRWPYADLGLLDDTHLRFFTRDNLVEMLRRAGFGAAEVRRTTAPLFGTELGVREEDVDPGVVESLRQDPEATTYQFVVRAVPDDADHAVERMAERELAARDRIVELEGRVARLERENAALVERVEAEMSRALDERVRVANAEDRAVVLATEIEAIHRTRIMRAFRVPRALYRRIRRSLSL